MRFITRSDLSKVFNGKSVAIVGSGPGLTDNPLGYVDSHDVVVRVNNYKILDHRTGFRTDVFYSFFGTSIKKAKSELLKDGVQVCMCKCPNSRFYNSPWHVQNRKNHGVDFRYIYFNRKSWWFTDTYIPSTEDFLTTFYLLGKRVPTTGFSAIIDILSLAPKNVYLTGFDFFRSGKHNLDEPWKSRNPTNPIGHDPDRELRWLIANMENYKVLVDPKLSAIIKKEIVR